MQAEAEIITCRVVVGARKNGRSLVADFGADFSSDIRTGDGVRCYVLARVVSSSVTHASTLLLFASLYRGRTQLPRPH